jgi:hypothetical protein
MLKKAMGYILVALFLLPSFTYGELNVDVDLGVEANIGDDELCLRINAHYFEKDPEYVRTAVRKHKMYEYYPIVLFLSYHSQKDVDFIVSLRQQELSWWEISSKLGVPVSAYYLDVGLKPVGPPYGKAYGYWKKHKKNPKYKFKLTDEEVFDLISLKMISSYYGMNAEDVIKSRKAGIEFKHIITNQYWKNRTSPGESKGNGNNKEKATAKNKKSSWKK